MLQSIKIFGLFGRFDYEISFSEHDVLIITGPNGYGKSTILRIIDSFCNEGLERVLGYPYTQLRILSDDKELRIEKMDNAVKINDYKVPYNDAYLNGMEDVSAITGHRWPEIFSLNGINQNNHSIIREFITSEESAERNFVQLVFYSTYLSKDVRTTKIKQAVDGILELVDAFRNSIGKVRFIQEQRLIERREIQESERRQRVRTEYVTAIKENSEKLKIELSEIMKRHSELSSNLDGTYIERLFAADPVEHVSEEMFSRLEELQLKQEKLKLYGLAGIQSASYLSNLDKNKLDRFGTELSIYLRDANEKYQVFEPIIEKLNLYEKIVNEKLGFKKMQLSSTDGISVVTDENVKLSLTDLSSGEQEILVLFYKLIFESDASLLLIDEPEISLHIAWQKELMENIKSVVKLKKNIRVIIATHSPQILSNNWDLQIDLGGQHNG